MCLYRAHILGLFFFLCLCATGSCSRSSRFASTIAQLEAANVDIVLKDGVPISLRAPHGIDLKKHLPAIARLNTLQCLRLPETKLDDASLAILRPLRDIRYLDISDNHITAAGCETLQSFKKLVALDLSFNSVGGDGVAALARCKALQSLDAYATSLVDDDLKLIGNIENLEWLGIGEEPFTGITDAGLRLLNTPKLKVLIIDGTGVRGGTLANASFRSTLIRLCANTSLFDDEGASNLRGYPALQTLDLGNSKITDVGVADICEISSLEYLGIGGTKTTNASLDHLRKLTALRRINTSRTDISKEQLLEVLPKVDFLYIAGRQRIIFPGYE